MLYNYGKIVVRIGKQKRQQNLCKSTCIYSPGKTSYLQAYSDKKTLTTHKLEAHNYGIQCVDYIELEKVNAKRYGGDPPTHAFTILPLGCHHTMTQLPH